MGRYDKLVHTFNKDKTGWGDFMPTYQAYFRGFDCMPEASFYSSYRCYMKEAFLDKVSNFHSEEEYLCFIGYDMTDPFGSFDAEIEFSIGMDLDHMEKHVITEPTIVRIPPFYWHCPLEFKRVTKPVYFQVMHLRGQFGTFAPQTGEDGKTRLIYTGLMQHACVHDKSKKCTYCGRCWRESQEKEQSGE